MINIPIFIGYDANETVAYHVCANSLIRTSTNRLSITPLALNNLTGYKETHTDGSNSFTYSRFLVPQLMDYQGWALFIDGDMVVTEDITNLWDLRDEQYAIMVVKHDYKTKMTTKYLGAKNENYPRKNWSSVILWNCAHEANRVITEEFVEKSTGPELHRFTWLNDNLVGSLPLEWNWLPDEYGENNNAKLLHYTLGTPCFAEFAHSPQANIWHDEYRQTIYSAQ